MISYTNSIVINASASEVFTYVNDPVKLPNWLTGLTETRNVVGTGEGQQWEWTYSMVGLQHRGMLVVVDYVANERFTAQSIGMIESSWTNICEPQEEGTKLTIEFEYSIPVPVLGKLAEHLTVRRVARDLDSSLLNVKETLEA